MNTDLQQLFDDSWQLLKNGSQSPDHPFHNFSVANFSGEEINVYTVVLRGIDTAAYEVLFYTDVRSEKVSEFKVNTQVSALFYDAVQQRQLIVKGHALIDYQNETSLQHWNRSGYKGRKSYLAQQPPSTPVSGPTDGLAYLQNKKFEDDDKEGYQNFAVVTIKAYEFESLQLSRQEGNRRARFKLVNENREGSWIIP